MNHNLPNPVECSSFRLIFGYAEIDHEEVPVMGVCGKLSRRSYLIPLNNAHQFAGSKTGAPTEYLIMQTLEIAELLGLGVDKWTCKEIADAIVDNLQTLVEMPPKALQTQNELMVEAEKAGLVLKLDGKTLIDAS